MIFEQVFFCRERLAYGSIEKPQWEVGGRRGGSRHSRGGEMEVIGRGLGLGKVIRLCLHGCILVLAPWEPEGVPVESMGPPVRWR